MAMPARCSIPIATRWDNFTEQKPTRNLGLKVKEQIFWVSREGLAELSPVFETLLYGSFQEATSNIVPLPGKKSKEILELLRCSFRSGPNLKPVDDRNVPILVKFADEYQIAHLMDECTKILMKQIPAISGNQKKIIDLLTVAVQYKVKPVARALFPIIACFHLCQLKAITKKFPAEVRCAIFIQVAVNVQDPCNGACEIDGVSVGNCAKPRAFSHTCENCHKSLSTHGETRGICRCIDPYADEELEKAGL